MTLNPPTPPAAIALVLQAAHFAADAHRDQRRKGSRNTPYINHPLDVAERLVRVAGIDDPVVLAAAILHDTIEDTTATAADLERLFGAAVARIVSDLSDDTSLHWTDRKRLEIAHARTLSPAAKLIKLSDKTSNVADTATNPPPDWTLGRRRDYLLFAERVAEGCAGTNAALDAEFQRVLAIARARIG